MLKPETKTEIKKREVLERRLKREKEAAERAAYYVRVDFFGFEDLKEIEYPESIIKKNVDYNYNYAKTLLEHGQKDLLKEVILTHDNIIKDIKRCSNLNRNLDPKLGCSYIFAGQKLRYEQFLSQIRIMNRGLLKAYKEYKTNQKRKI